MRAVTEFRIVSARVFGGTCSESDLDDERRVIAELGDRHVIEYVAADYPLVRSGIGKHAVDLPRCGLQVETVLRRRC
jgi:hypothetical protein